MPAVISLRDVIEALDLQSDELSSCLDPDSGEIITFNEEEEPSPNVAIGPRRRIGCARTCPRSNER